MQMFCCSMIKDQKLYICPASKKGFIIYLASFSFTCEHIYQLTFYSYPSVLTFVTLNFKQRKEVSQRKTVQWALTDSHTPELHFSDTVSAGDQNTGFSSPNVNQSVSLKKQLVDFLHEGIQVFTPQSRDWRSPLFPKYAKHKAKQAMRHCSPVSGTQTKEEEA